MKKFGFSKHIGFSLFLLLLLFDKKSILILKKKKKRRDTHEFWLWIMDEALSPLKELDQNDWAVRNMEG
jgi:hypothetical protein